MAEKSPVLVINHQALIPNARAIGYTIAVNFIDEYATINAAFGAMRPAKLLVYMVIILASVQKYMRGPNPTNVGILPMEEADCGHISRRAVAEATGIPRENVRRIIKELIDDGTVIECSDGNVRQPTGFMAGAGMADSTVDLLHGLVKTIQHLIDMNVVKIKS